MTLCRITSHRGWHQEMTSWRRSCGRSRRLSSVPHTPMFQQTSSTSPTSATTSSMSSYHGVHCARSSHPARSSSHRIYGAVRTISCLMNRAPHPRVLWRDQNCPNRPRLQANLRHVDLCRKSISLSCRREDDFRWMIPDLNRRPSTTIVFSVSHPSSSSHHWESLRLTSPALGCHQSCLVSLGRWEKILSFFHVITCGCFIIRLIFFFNLNH